MPGLLGTTKLYEITEQVKSILKIHGDFSFFAIPTDLLNKYGVESFDIIDSDNKIMLIGPRIAQGPTTEKPTRLMEASNIAK